MYGEKKFLLYRYYEISEFGIMRDYCNWKTHSDICSLFITFFILNILFVWWHLSDIPFYTLKVYDQQSCMKYTSHTRLENVHVIIFFIIGQWYWLRLCDLKINETLKEQFYPSKKKCVFHFSLVPTHVLTANNLCSFTVIYLTAKSKWNWL